MASAWALIKDNRELLFVRRSFDLGRGGQWCPPGGTIWQQESPEIACVREAYEETNLRISVQEPIAQFDTAYYFFCTLNGDRDDLALREEECIDAEWIQPPDILDLGTVMDLKRIIPILDIAGLRPPSVPDGLEPAMPEKIF